MSEDGGKDVDETEKCGEIHIKSRMLLRSTREGAGLGEQGFLIGDILRPHHYEREADIVFTKHQRIDWSPISLHHLLSKGMKMGRCTAWRPKSLDAVSASLTSTGTSEGVVG